MTTPDTAGLPELPVIGYYGLNNDGYEVISLKESHVLRMFDAGEVTAQPVCLISDALAAVRSAQAAQPGRKPLSDAEIDELSEAIWGSELDYKHIKEIEFARAIERAHGIGEPK